MPAMSATCPHTWWSMQACWGWVTRLTYSTVYGLWSTCSVDLLGWALISSTDKADSSGLPDLLEHIWLASVGHKPRPQCTDVLTWLSSHISLSSITNNYGLNSLNYIGTTVVYGTLRCYRYHHVRKEGYTFYTTHFNVQFVLLPSYYCASALSYY